MGCETPCSPADKYQYYRETCYILSATLFHPEDGSNTFLCNDSTHPSHYVASHCPTPILLLSYITVHSSWNVMAHSDTQEGKWRGNWRMEWVASTLHTTSEHGVSSITTADAHTSAASSQLNWRPCRFKWTRLFHRKTKSGFCMCHHISTGLYLEWRQQDSSVSIVTRLQRSRNCSSTPSKDKWLLSSLKYPDQLWGPPNLPGVKEDNTQRCIFTSILCQH